MDQLIIDAINKAFDTAYPPSAPTEDPVILKKRIDMLLDDLLCNRQNFKICNDAYIQIDARLRTFRHQYGEKK